MWESLSTTGIRIIVTVAIMGAVIACIADAMGKRIGRAHVRLFGLRPRTNARILTVLGGALIGVLSVVTLAATSNTARVALFKLETITAQIKFLEKERNVISENLQKSKAEVDRQNKIITSLDEKIAMANRDLTAAKKEVDELNDSKNKLAGEVVKLQKNTQILRDGITIMRQGELLYRGGEVVYAGVMRGNLRHKENDIQLDWFMTSANSAALAKAGIEPKNPGDPMPQAIAFQNETVSRALEELNKAKNDKFFRVRALTNVMAGEISPCTLEIFDNVLVYANGTTIYREEYNIKKNDTRVKENIMMELLAQVNRSAVAAGVLPDPISGNVGGMTADGVLKITSQLKRAGKHFLVAAKADGDIYTSGPVRINFNVEKIQEE